MKVALTELPSFALHCRNESSKAGIHGKCSWTVSAVDPDTLHNRYLLCPQLEPVVMGIGSGLFCPARMGHALLSVGSS